MTQEKPVGNTLEKEFTLQQRAKRLLFYYHNSLFQGKYAEITNKLIESYNSDSEEVIENKVFREKFTKIRNILVRISNSTSLESNDFLEKISSEIKSLDIIGFRINPYKDKIFFEDVFYFPKYYESKVGLINLDEFINLLEDIIEESFSPKIETDNENKEMLNEKEEKIAFVISRIDNNIFDEKVDNIINSLTLDELNFKIPIKGRGHSKSILNSLLKALDRGRIVNINFIDSTNSEICIFRKRTVEMLAFYFKFRKNKNFFNDDCTFKAETDFPLERYYQNLVSQIIKNIFDSYDFILKKVEHLNQKSHPFIYYIYINIKYLCNIVSDGNFIGLISILRNDDMHNSYILIKDYIYFLLDFDETGTWDYEFTKPIEFIGDNSKINFNVIYNFFELEKFKNLLLKNKKSDIDIGGLTKVKNPNGGIMGSVRFHIRKFLNRKNKK